jgi:thioredoxin reductase (NADPH)
MTTTTEHYDLLIIGAGPTGLSAAIYAAREGMQTLVIDKSVVGGLAAITDRIDNYPGFEEGVGGYELAERLEKQAKRFGAEVRTGVEADTIAAQPGTLSVGTNQGELTAASVLIATGSTYRQLGIPGEAEQIGKGVHFCATCDGPIYKGRDLVVVGGGNSAVQETLFLARFAKNITILVRGPELKASAILIEQLQALDNVKLVFNVTATSIESAEGRVKAVVSGDKRYPCDGVFVFVGLLANTEAFVHAIDHDERNFLKTDLSYATNLPGVFVAGDVRSGSTWQIASAVGEGVSAALSVRAYLDKMKHEALTA